MKLTFLIFFIFYGFYFCLTSFASNELIIPKRAKEFTRTIQKESPAEGSDGPKQNGIIIYKYNNKKSMIINSGKLIKASKYKEHKESLSQVEKLFQTKQIKFITGSKDWNKLDIRKELFLFDNNNDSYSYPVGEINDLEYAKADKTKIIYSLEGQEFGTIVIHVFAKKGDNFILLSGSPDLDYKSINLKCDIPKKFNMSKEDFLKDDYLSNTISSCECCIKLLRTDSKIQESLKKEAKELISLFST